VVIASPGVGSERDDTRVCEAASRFAQGFGDYWTNKVETGKRLKDPVQPNDFAAVCHGMADNVQRCMHEKYREVHAEACDAVLMRLDGASRSRINGLFIEADAKGI
jgi:hypothetical protein